MPRHKKARRGQQTAFVTEENDLKNRIITLRQDGYIVTLANFHTINQTPHQTVDVLNIVVILLVVHVPYVVNKRGSHCQIKER